MHNFLLFTSKYINIVSSLYAIICFFKILNYRIVFNYIDLPYLIKFLLLNIHFHSFYFYKQYWGEHPCS